MLCFICECEASYKYSTLVEGGNQALVKACHVKLEHNTSFEDMLKKLSKLGAGNQADASISLNSFPFTRGSPTNIKV